MGWASLVAVSFSSGLVAAVSPCVIVLVPLVLFRFLRRVELSKQAKDGEVTGRKGALSIQRVYQQSLFAQVVTFVTGFELAYLVLGYAIQGLMVSSVQKGFRLGSGVLFLVMAILAFFGRLESVNIPVFENTFLLGMSFAGLLTLNPCTVPFLAMIVSYSRTESLSALFFFAQGLLVPSLVFLALGRTVIAFLKQGSGIIAVINRVTSLALAASGVYFLISDPFLTTGDMALAALLLATATLLVLRACDLLYSPSYILLLLLLTWFVTIGTLVILFHAAPHNLESHVEYTEAMDTSVAVTTSSPGDTGGFEPVREGQFEPGGVDDDPAAPDEGKCVDITLIPPCDTCVMARHVYALLSSLLALFLLLLVLAPQRRRKSKKKGSILPVSQVEITHSSKRDQGMGEEELFEDITVHALLSSGRRRRGYRGSLATTVTSLTSALTAPVVQVPSSALSWLWSRVAMVKQDTPQPDLPTWRYDSNALTL